MVQESRISPESLLNLPLVRAAIEDPFFKKVARGIDQNWKDEGFIPVSVSGFNPYLSAGFIAAKSSLREWLKKPESSVRPLNSSDRLVRQALFFAHDYLHAWAISEIREMVESDFSYGTDSVNAKNIEDYVFCHLLTEAVATVGLDYWFLSQIKLNELCPIGTRVKCLTIGYHSDYDGEIQRINPELKINERRFFDFMSRFYCDGVFPGFTLGELDQSPILMNWIDHEVLYGEKQREYACLWFSYLSKEGLGSVRRHPEGPVQIRKPWQQKLLSKLGERLWELTRKPSFAIRSFDSSRLWRYADERAPDPRFSNLIHYDLKTMLKCASVGPDKEQKLGYLAYQYVSQYDLKKCALKTLRLIPELIEKRDLKSLERVLNGHSKIRRSNEEPAHLLMLN
jgi:hypothetical protein